MDPSGQSSQTMDNTGMEPVYYNAAAEGKIEDFENIPEPLNQLLTPKRNTVLHIHLANPIKRSEDSESSKTFVEKILAKCPLLLRHANFKGETPLHIAARYGHAAIVDVLIRHARERAPQEDLENGVNNAVQKMLEMTNNEKDTALHEAVRGNHLKVVERLIDENNNFSYSQNDAGETPLYIAVERNYVEVASYILDNCTSPAHDGPLGRTALHAAVIEDNKDMMKKILGVDSSLIKQVDKQRWTPLHCAAYCGSLLGASVLLGFNRSVAYMKDAKGMTALHIAAHRGHHSVMEDILELCPDCCEQVDERGWNALHFVVNSSSSYWAKYGGLRNILKISSISNLLNEKDARGNTPLHLHSKSLHYIQDVMCHKRVDKMAFNKQNVNPYDIALTNEELSDKKFMEITSAFIGKRCRAGFRKPLGEDILPKRRNYEVEREARKAERRASKIRFVSIMKETSHYHLVVDTLIATVTFAAGITMPGGVIGQEGPDFGSPVLMRNDYFKIFIVLNSVAFVQSCSAAFIQLFMPLLFRDKNPGASSFLLAVLAFFLSISAMGAMVLAFVFGTSAVLWHALGFARVIVVLGLSFLILVYLVVFGFMDYIGGRNLDIEP